MRFLPGRAVVGSFVLGLAMPLGFAPFGLFPLTILGVAGLFALFEGASPGEAAKRGFAFGAGTFLAGTYWLYISIHIFGGAPVVLAVFLMLSLVCIMGAYFALMGFAAKRWCWVSDDALRFMLVLPALWVLAEWLRGFLFSGFPWLSLGYSQIDSPLGGWAPHLGVHGVSAAAAVSGGALVLLIRGSLRARVAAIVLAAALWGGGYWSQLQAWTRPVGDPLQVSLMQGAVSQDLKWAREQLAPTMSLYRRLTFENLGSDLIIWPEAAIPSLLHLVQDYLRGVYIQAEAQGSTVLLGMLREDSVTGEYENTLVVLGDEQQVYTKRHLVPFGEYFPVPAFVREWMRLMSLPYSDTAPGDARQPTLRAANQQIAATICYEDAFGAEQLVFLPEATLLVNVSNDAWFGDSIAPHQHLQIARMRAKETGRYLLRSTNTGISAVINERGKMVSRAPQFETHVLTAKAQPFEGATLYVRLGNWGVVSAATLIVLLAFARVRMRHKGAAGPW